uniref:Methyltransferase domain-containing protein n=2 Tax=Oryza TaxID=4527 RepID=A0A0E0IPF3_ORYNI
MHALPRSRLGFGFFASMSSSAARVGGGGGRDPSNNPAVGRLRELVQRGDAADGWEKSWEAAVTPWDLGKPTPIIEHLVKSGTLPKGRALGYDVVALASPERFVVGLDISSTAVEKAKQWSSSLPNADCFTFLADDFFKWKPSEQFDLIFDYTFFCALDPSLRLAWAETVSGLLKPHGELITLIYLVTEESIYSFVYFSIEDVMISDQEGGPPFNNTVTDYQKVLEPLGFKAILMEDNELAIKPRKGQEKLGRWKRFVPGSSL